VPGEKNYFLASDNPLAPHITPLIEKKGIENEYVNRYYLDDDLIQMRSRTVVDQFDDTVEINHDFKPFMFVKQSGHWLSLFKTTYRLLMILPALFFLFLFVKQNPITVGLYTGGFTGSSLEVTMMLAYQIFVGSIYLASAFFFAAFMGGLAAGSYLRYEMPKAKQVKSYYMLQFILAGFALLLPILIFFIDSVSGWIPIVQLIFFLLVFALAFGIGFEFNLASKLQKKSFSETSGVNYSTDLAGSAFGAFLTALFILPVLGLTFTCFVVALLNIISGMIAFSARNKPIFL